MVTCVQIFFYTMMLMPMLLVSLFFYSVTVQQARWTGLLLPTWLL
jgi:hypothetical protein